MSLVLMMLLLKCGPLAEREALEPGSQPTASDITSISLQHQGARFEALHQLGVVCSEFRQGSNQNLPRVLDLPGAAVNNGQVFPSNVLDRRKPIVGLDNRLYGLGSGPLVIGRDFTIDEIIQSDDRTMVALDRDREEMALIEGEKLARRQQNVVCAFWRDGKLGYVGRGKEETQLIAWGGHERQVPKQFEISHCTPDGRMFLARQTASGKGTWLVVLEQDGADFRVLAASAPKNYIAENVTMDRLYINRRTGRILVTVSTSTLGADRRFATAFVGTLASKKLTAIQPSAEGIWAVVPNSADADLRSVAFWHYSERKAGGLEPRLVLYGLDTHRKEGSLAANAVGVSAGSNPYAIVHGEGQLYLAKIRLPVSRVLR